MQTFTLTEDHIKLLQSFYVGWQDCEYGAPEIDPKRPYGNSGVECDIHEILTGETEYELADKQRERYAALHRETQTALQIVLVTGEMAPGLYQKTMKYDSRTWLRATDQSTGNQP